MITTKKLRVALLYGGRSGEHEISLRSAAFILHSLDRDKFEPVLIGIDKQGRWLLQDSSQQQNTLRIQLEQSPLLLSTNAMTSSFLSTTTPLGKQLGTSTFSLPPIDVVFPVLHGSYGEDGTLQGLLEVTNVPYVGCGVLSSAICMDKEIAKKLVSAAGIPVVPYLTLTRSEWNKNPSAIMAEIKKTIGYPCFVKPANAGSSLGTSKIKSECPLSTGIFEAFRYDEKIIIEKFIDAREIEVSVLENSIFGEPALASVVGEIEPHHEFYSYEAKYLDDNGASFHIPAKLTTEQSENVREMAIKAFAALQGEGMGRIDFFLCRTTGNVYFNEINTIPGFTSISMYPKLWEASGIDAKELVSILIERAIQRHNRKKSLLRDYQP